MPAFDLESQRPHGSFEPSPPDGWSMPLGRLGGIQFYVSYSVFVALAVLAGFVAIVQHRDGNGDLPEVTLVAIAIWGTGWLVQAIVLICLHFRTQAKSDTISIGLLGVESPRPLYRRHPWTAMETLIAAFGSLTALVVFGLACLTVHMLTRAADASLWSYWVSELARPSFGLDTTEHCYLMATWLFWIQAACQAYPLPRNLGRGALASVVVLFAPESGERMQLRLLQRFLLLIAVVTLVIAVATRMAETGAFFPQWPILVFLAGLLWFSASREDLQDWITSLHVAGNDPAADHFQNELNPAELGRDYPEVTGNTTLDPQGDLSPGGSLVESIRMRQRRKRARQALQRERAEAQDASRLDEVLQRVSTHGADALSREDRALLDRVSQSLRRHRDDSDSGSEKPDADEPDQPSSGRD